jgi:hypothetical protein
MEPMELPMLKEKEKPLNKGLRMLLIIIPMELGGEEPSKWERKNFLRESILISTFTEEGEIIENDSSIRLLHAALNPLMGNK